MTRLQQPVAPLVREPRLSTCVACGAGNHDVLWPVRAAASERHNVVDVIAPPDSTTAPVAAATLACTLSGDIGLRVRPFCSPPSGCIVPPARHASRAAAVPGVVLPPLARVLAPIVGRQIVVHAAASDLLRAVRCVVSARVFVGLIRVIGEPAALVGGALLPVLRVIAAVVGAPLVAVTLSISSGVPLGLLRVSDAVRIRLRLHAVLAARVEHKPVTALATIEMLAVCRKRNAALRAGLERGTIGAHRTSVVRCHAPGCVQHRRGTFVPPFYHVEAAA